MMLKTYNSHFKFVSSKYKIIFKAIIMCLQSISITKYLYTVSIGEDNVNV